TVPGGGTLALVTCVRGWSTVQSAGLPAEKPEPLCPHPPTSKDEALGLNSYDSVIFEGDRVDAAAKTIGAKIDPRWFNIGCAGHTLAKMALTGHTESAVKLGFSTSIAQRQTMLKMLSADYCGDGTPFTVSGQPLQWADDLGWMHAAPDAQLEARWTSTGASCLMKPRVEAHPTKASFVAFHSNAELEARIAAHCRRPPKC